MSRWWTNGPAYLQIVALWPQTAFAYRANMIFHVLGFLLKVYLLKAIWTAVYADQGEAGSAELRQVIGFITLAQIQVWLMSPEIAQFIQERVSDGKVALDLARPVPYLGQLLAHQLGATASLLPFVALTVPFAFVLGGFVAPASWSAGLLYLFSMALGYVVAVELALVIGLFSFWTFSIWGIVDIYGYTNQFFTGALVPLWFFPGWLRTVADLLPFQAQTFIPLSLYVGRVSASEIPGALGVQAAWVAVLSVVVWLMWQRAMRRVVIQGG